MDEPRRRLGAKYCPKVVAADATCSLLVRCLLRSELRVALKRFFGDVSNRPSGIRYAGPADRSSEEFESHPGNYEAPICGQVLCRLSTTSNSDALTKDGRFPSWFPATP